VTAVRFLFPHAAHGASTLAAASSGWWRGWRVVWALNPYPSFQALALASQNAENHPFCFRRNRVSLSATYHSLHSHFHSQTFSFIAGTVSPSCLHVFAHWCHRIIMLSMLRVGLRVWFAEA